MEDKTSRYERQIIVFGKSGQQKLAKARVAVIGCGGLGTIAAQYLVMAGVSLLRLVDYDAIKTSNLNRQFYCPSETGGRKASSLKKRLECLNPDMKIEAVQEKLADSNCESLIRDCDVVLDCMDNLEGRLSLSKACEKLGKPLVHGSIDAMSGQQITFLKGSGYIGRLYEGKAFSNSKIPVLGPVVGFIGCLQALEAMKLITGFGSPNTQLLVFDGERNRFDYVKV